MNHFSSKILNFTLKTTGYWCSRDKSAFKIFLQKFGIIATTLSMVQSLLYSLTSGSIDGVGALAIFTAIAGCQSLVKILSVYTYQDELWAMKIELDVMSLNMAFNQRTERIREFAACKRFVNSMFIITFVLSAQGYIIVPAIQLIVAFSTNIEFPKSFINQFWFPFDKNHYFLLVRVYELIISSMYSMTLLTIEGFVMMTLGQTAILLKCLGDDIAEVINNCDESRENEDWKMLTSKIQLHEKLLKMAYRITNVYDKAMLVHVMGFASSTCMLLLKIFVVDSNEDAATSILVLLNMSLYFYYICYFGEKIMESVSERLINMKSSIYLIERLFSDISYRSTNWREQLSFIKHKNAKDSCVCLVEISASTIFESMEVFPVETFDIYMVSSCFLFIVYRIEACCPRQP